MLSERLMAAFPYYDSSELKTLETQADAILGAFRARGYVREEPSVLQPADIFLDRSGEEIRRRTFTLTDPSGRDLCLRPDLTIPDLPSCGEVGHAKFPARICYNGLVFRHQPSEPHRPTQFFQAGVELLGLEDRAAGETEIMTLAVEALRAAGLKDFTVKIGDLALFGALVDALDVPGAMARAAEAAFLARGLFRGAAGPHDPGCGQRCAAPAGLAGRPHAKRIARRHRRADGSWWPMRRRARAPARKSSSG